MNLTEAMQSKVDPTVKMETLCSRFCVDILITTHHIDIPLHREAK